MQLVAAAKLPNALTEIPTNSMLWSLAQFPGRQSSVRLLQNPYDLLFRCIGSSASDVLLLTNAAYRPNLSENSHYRWTIRRDAAQHG